MISSIKCICIFISPENVFWGGRGILDGKNMIWKCHSLINLQCIFQFQKFSSWITSKGPLGENNWIGIHAEIYSQKDKLLKRVLDYWTSVIRLIGRQSNRAMCIACENIFWMREVADVCFTLWWKSFIGWIIITGGVDRARFDIFKLRMIRGFCVICTSARTGMVKVGKIVLAVSRFAWWTPSPFLNYTHSKE